MGRSEQAAVVFNVEGNATKAMIDLNAAFEASVKIVEWVGKGFRKFRKSNDEVNQSVLSGVRAMDSLDSSSKGAIDTQQRHGRIVGGLRFALEGLSRATGIQILKSEELGEQLEDGEGKVGKLKNAVKSLAERSKGLFQGLADDAGSLAAALGGLAIVGIAAQHESELKSIAKDYDTTKYSLKDLRDAVVEFRRETGASFEDASTFFEVISATAEGNLKRAKEYVPLARLLQEGIGVEADTAARLFDNLVRVGQIDPKAAVNVAAAITRIGESSGATQEDIIELVQQFTQEGVFKRIEKDAQGAIVRFAAVEAAMRSAGIEGDNTAGILDQIITYTDEQGQSLTNQIHAITGVNIADAVQQGRPDIAFAKISEAAQELARINPQLVNGFQTVAAEALGLDPNFFVNLADRSDLFRMKLSELSDRGLKDFGDGTLYLEQRAEKIRPLLERLEILGNKIAASFEMLGNKVLDFVSPAVAGKFIPFMENALDAWDNFVGDLDLKQVLIIGGGFVAVTTLGGPFLALLGTITGLVTGLIAKFIFVKTLLPLVGKAFSAIGLKGIGASFSSLGTTLTNATSGISGFFNSLKTGTGILNIFKVPFKIVTSLFKLFAKASVIGTAIIWVLDALPQVWDNFSALIDLIKGDIELADFAKRIASNMVRIVLDPVRDIAKTILSIPGVKHLLPDWIEGGLESFANWDAEAAFGVQRGLTGSTADEIMGGTDENIEFYGDKIIQSEAKINESLMQLAKDRKSMTEDQISDLEDTIRRERELNIKVKEAFSNRYGVEAEDLDKYQNLSEVKYGEGNLTIDVTPSEFKSKDEAQMYIDKVAPHLETLNAEQRMQFNKVMDDYLAGKWDESFWDSWTSRPKRTYGSQSPKEPEPDWEEERRYLIEDLKMPPEHADIVIESDKKRYKEGNKQFGQAETGAYVVDEGLVNLHPGEIVLPADVSKAFLNFNDVNSKSARSSQGGLLAKTLSESAVSQEPPHVVQERRRYMKESLAAAKSTSENTGMMTDRQDYMIALNRNQWNAQQRNNKTIFETPLVDLTDLLADKLPNQFKDIRDAITDDDFKTDFKEWMEMDQGTAQNLEVKLDPQSTAEAYSPLNDNLADLEQTTARLADTNRTLSSNVSNLGDSSMTVAVPTGPGDELMWDPKSKTFMPRSEMEGGSYSVTTPFTQNYDSFNRDNITGPGSMFGLDYTPGQTDPRLEENHRMSMQLIELSKERNELAKSSSQMNLSAFTRQEARDQERNSFLGSIGDGMRDLGSGMRDGFRWIGSNISKGASSVKSGASNLFNLIPGSEKISGALKDLPGVSNVLKDKLSGLASKIPGGKGTFGAAIAGGAEKLLQGDIKGALSSGLSSGATFATTAALTPMLGPFAPFVGGLLGPKLADAAKKLGGKALGAIKSVGGLVGGGLSKAGDLLGNVPGFSSIGRGIGSIFGGIGKVFGFGGEDAARARGNLLKSLARDHLRGDRDLFDLKKKDRERLAKSIDSQKKFDLTQAALVKGFGVSPDVAKSWLVGNADKNALTKEQKEAVSSSFRDAFASSDVSLEELTSTKAFERLVDSARGDVSSIINQDEEVPSAQTGGYVTREGLVNLHAGEVILPSEVARKFMDQMEPMDPVELVNPLSAIMDEIRPPQGQRRKPTKVETDVDLNETEMLLRHIRDDQRTGLRRNKLLDVAENLSY